MNNRFLFKLSKIYLELQQHSRPREEVLTEKVNDKLDANMAVYEYELEKFMKSLTAFEQLQILSKGYEGL